MDLSDAYVRKDLQNIDAYGDANSTITFPGPMRYFLFHNRDAAFDMFVCWGQRGDDAFCLKPGQAITVIRGAKVLEIMVRRSAGAAGAPVYFDISASALSEFHT